MALLWMDGFDTYGDDEALMLDGLWADITGGSTFFLSTANPRTGSRALRWASSLGSARRVFGGDKATVGIGYGLYMASLPGANAALNLGLNDSANAAQVTYTVDTTGVVRLLRGNAAGTQIAATSAPVLTAGAYAHWECKTTIHDSAGAAELRINEVTVLSASGLDSKATAIAGAAQMVWPGNPPLTPPVSDFDDLFVWDTATTDPVGADVVDFVGDKRVYEDPPNADGSEQDWLRSTGSASWSLVDDIPPNDDADYVSTATPGAKVALSFPDLPVNLRDVIALQFDHRSRKTDAGTAQMKLSARSGASSVDGGSGAVSTAYRSYSMVSQADPSTGDRYLPAAANAVQAIPERTA